MPRRLRPTADIFEDAILVGDPGRAMALAQVVIDGPKMSNHARGLWGYSGLTAEGRGLTVQATGMGGPSAALVLRDLAELGVRRAVRIGTCTALPEGAGRADHVGDAAPLQVGGLVIVEEARPWSFGGQPGAVAFPDPHLARRLGAELGGAARPARAASLDVLHPAPGHPLPEGDVADMQTAALFAAGSELGVAIAAALIVTEAGDAGHLDDEALAERAAFVAERAVRALFA